MFPTLTSLDPRPCHPHLLPESLVEVTLTYFPRSLSVSPTYFLKSTSWDPRRGHPHLLPEILVQVTLTYSLRASSVSPSLLPKILVQVTLIYFLRSSSRSPSFTPWDPRPGHPHLLPEILILAELLVRVPLVTGRLTFRRLPLALLRFSLLPLLEILRVELRRYKKMTRL